MGRLPLPKPPNAVSRKPRDAPPHYLSKANIKPKSTAYTATSNQTGVRAMDLAERAKSVENALESGEGCSAMKLLSDLSPAERLTVLKQAVAGNNMKAADGVPILDFTATPPDAPLTDTDKIVWVTKSKTKTETPVKLIGFNDLTVLPCKNVR